jgi:hypothetical protein
MDTIISTQDLIPNENNSKTIGNIEKQYKEVYTNELILKNNTFEFNVINIIEKLYGREFPVIYSDKPEPMENAFVLYIPLHERSEFELRNSPVLLTIKNNKVEIKIKFHYDINVPHDNYIDYNDLTNIVLKDLMVFLPSNYIIIKNNETHISFNDAQTETYGNYIKYDLFGNFGKVNINLKDNEKIRKNGDIDLFYLGTPTKVARKNIIKIPVVIDNKPLNGSVVFDVPGGLHNNKCGITLDTNLSEAIIIDEIVINIKLCFTYDLEAENIDIDFFNKLLTNIKIILPNEYIEDVNNNYGGNDYIKIYLNDVVLKDMGIGLSSKGSKSQYYYRFWKDNDLLFPSSGTIKIDVTSSITKDLMLKEPDFKNGYTYQTIEYGTSAFKHIHILNMSVNDFYKYIKNVNLIFKSLVSTVIELEMDLEFTIYYENMESTDLPDFINVINTKTSIMFPLNYKNVNIQETGYDLKVYNNPYMTVIGKVYTNETSITFNITSNNIPTSSTVSRYLQFSVKVKYLI